MCLILLPARSPAASQPLSLMPIQQFPLTPRYSPTALGTIWIQIKSTPKWLSGIKASLTENVREGEMVGAKNTTIYLVDLKVAVQIDFSSFGMFFKNVLY